MRRKATARISRPPDTRPRPEHALLIAVGNLLPASLPDRNDIRQDIIVAILEGTTSLAELQSDRSAVRKFCRGHVKGNFEAGGYAVSLSQPRHDGRSWHDLIADTSENQWGRL